MSDVTDAINEIEERIAIARDGLRRARQSAPAKQAEALAARQVAEHEDEIARLTLLLLELESGVGPPLA
ncbi:hypothetical protein PY650_29700 [Rhizobium calliandrae]|uniref:Uncharacterized protein n=1 Tax=Rhizobium calliandrae TaxID=1312182 RepID=A0ABT7KM55_9HYPH|nr:hypothetical protein [Rhizobium calliandrae]MDL2409724.1 hypothetical protein [Rhizobium calliandrae]